MRRRKKVELMFLLERNQKRKMKLYSFHIYPKISFSMAELKKIIEKYDENELKRDLNQFLPVSYRNFYRKLKQEVISFFRKS